MASLRDALYYEEQGLTLYCGDARELLPLVEPVDLVLTDPPYGIARVWGGGGGHGWKNRAHPARTTRNAWDHPIGAEVMQAVVAGGDAVIVWGGNYFALPVSRGWLVWNKPERGLTLAEAELAWTNQDTVVRVFDVPRSDAGREHPTQKPLRLFQRCILWADERTGRRMTTVLDPFAGSGTALIAAQNLGRHAIGIEREPRYCRMIVKRLRQDVLALEPA